MRHAIAQQCSEKGQDDYSLQRKSTVAQVLELYQINLKKTKNKKNKSNGTDHPTVLTWPGHVMHMIKVVFLATVSHCFRILINSFEGILTISFCPFVQRPLSFY